MSKRPSGKYKQVLEYLSNSHDKSNPATIRQIADGANVSEPSVFRLLQDKLNGDVGDETVSPGIFRSQDETRVGFGRPARMFYADLTRITDANVIDVAVNSVALKVPLPKQPVAYLLTGYYRWTGSLEGVLASLRQSVESAVLNKASTRTIYEALFSISESDKPFLEKAIANYDSVMNDGGVVDSDLHKDMAEGIRNLRQYHAGIVMQCDRLMQDPAFDTNPMLLLDPNREALVPIHPVVRKV